MHTDFHFSIPKPCSANWNEMSADAQGRFCGLCNHVVVDFTKMSEKEIKEYFRSNAPQKTCGRFKTSQLAVQKRNYFSVRAMLLWGFTVLTVMVGCRKPPHHKMGKVAPGPAIEQTK